MRLEPFAAGDVPAVAELHARARPRTAWSSQEARARYFREALLENPWADPELPSLVAKDGERVVGFFGVVPRRMRFGERRLRVAVGCQFMVDPQERNGLVALRLMRAFLGGRQDVSVADWATEASRSLWLAAGGSASVLQEQQWMLLLRPVQSLWQHAMRARPVVAALGAPLAALADACASPLLVRPPEAGLREQPLDAPSLLAALEETGRRFAIRPDYDLASLEWLLAQAAAKKRHGELQGSLVRDAAGIVGWYLYYLNRGASQVLQLGARHERLRAVLRCLGRDARAKGALALEGRMEPALAGELACSNCLLQNRGLAVLLHARDPQLLIPFLRGDAFFSRLDGEWWMRFYGDLEGEKGLREAWTRKRYRPAAPSRVERSAPHGAATRVYPQTGRL